MTRWLKFLLGVALLPLAYALTRVFGDALLGQTLAKGVNQMTAWFLGGFGVWLALSFLFPRPVRTYVLGHELTHALWGIFMGAKVSKLRVSAKGGSVTLDKTNMWITLAPYFFPFYTILALAIYVALGWWIDVSTYTPFFYAVYGATWCFHLVFTIQMLGIRQPDIQEHGRLFSYVVIYCINLAVAALLLLVLTEQAPLAMARETWEQTRHAYAASLAGLRYLNSQMAGGAFW
ncbi:MAG TPA: hypothetical protein PKE26_02375 [Kiritimatiellia bacterium]|nr:hypothetical protein [Kiritimatiellia bacterium]